MEPPRINPVHSRFLTTWKGPPERAVPLYKVRRRSTTFAVPYWWFLRGGVVYAGLRKKDALHHVIWQPVCQGSPRRRQGGHPQTVITLRERPGDASPRLSTTWRTFPQCTVHYPPANSMETQQGVFDEPWTETLKSGDSVRPEAHWVVVSLVQRYPRHRPQDSF